MADEKLNTGPGKQNAPPAPKQDRRSSARYSFSGGHSVFKVLSIKENGNYITVESDITAESYVFGLSGFYGIIVGLSALYPVIYLAAWIVILRKQQKEKMEL